MTTAPPVPEWFFLQTSDVQLRQVSRMLLSGGGDLWQAMLGMRGYKAPVSLRTENALPVYPIDVTSAVLDAMLDILRVPDTRRDAWLCLPDAVTGQMSLRVWRGMMRYYGFVATEDLDDNDAWDEKRASKKRQRDEEGDEADEADEEEEENADAPDTDEPKRKKRRTQLSPFDEKILRVSAALHAFIWANHPEAAAFLSGATDKLVCQFVINYHNGYPRPDSYTFTHDDLNGNDACIGWFLGRRLSVEQLKRVMHDLAVRSPPRTVVSGYWRHTRDGNSRAQKLAHFTHWPLSADDKQSVGVTKQYHEIFELYFRYE